MLWIVLALAGAFANAAYFITTKDLLATVDRNVLAAGSFLLSGTLLFLIALARGIPQPGNDLVMAIAMTSLLNIIATGLVFRALATTDLSLSVPMLSFTPVFLIVTSFLLLGEIPTGVGIAGILSIVSGSYVLNLTQADRGCADPVRAILRSRGAGYMILVAFLYSIALNFDKMVVLNSDPVFGSALVCLVLGISFSCIAAASFLRAGGWGAHAPGRRSPDRDAGTDSDRPPPLPQTRSPGMMEPISTHAPGFLVLGILLTLEVVSINCAFMLQIVPYVIALKRMSIILAVLYGTVVAGEKSGSFRLWGAALMVIGAVLIVLSG